MVLLVGTVYGLALAGSVLIGSTGYGMFVVAGVFALIGGVAVVLWPQIGLYILVIFLFTNASDVLQVSFGLPSTNKPLVALLLISTLASQTFLHHKPLVFRLTEIVIMGYGFAVLISLVGSGENYDTLSQVLDWAKDFAILLIIVQLADDENVWKNMQWAVILSALALALMTCFQSATGNFSNNFFGFANAPVHEVVEGFDSNRVTGPLEDPNFYGMIMVMVLPMAIYRMLTERGVLGRAVGALASLTIIAAIILTYSRGAFLAMAVVGVLIMRERKMNLYKIGAAAALVAVLVLPQLPAGFIARLNTLTDILPSSLKLQTESSLRGRSSEALVALRMFADHPVAGVGRMRYADMYLEYSPQLGLDSRLEARQAHSLYLELLAETGVIGVTVFGAILLVLYTGLHRAKKFFVHIQRYDLIPWVSGVKYGLTGYLLASLFLHADYIRYLWLIIAFAAATTVLASEKYRRFSQSQLAPEV